MSKGFLLVFLFFCFPGIVLAEGKSEDIKNESIISDNVTSRRGVLQTYWLPVWHEEGDKNSPQLKARFFDLEKKEIEVINILNVDDSLLKRSFMVVPDSFLNYKEGHVEQYGKIKLKNIRDYTECNRGWLYAEIVGFIAQQRENLDLDELESSTGCEKYPYVITYAVNSDLKCLDFKGEPNDNASNVFSISAGTIITSIKAVNDDWIYAAVYDENSPGMAGSIRGYVKREFISPVN